MPPEEQRVMDNLVAAWNGFLKLEEPKDSVDDFRRSIHEAQRILAQRLARRHYKGWN